VSTAEKRPTKGQRSPSRASVRGINRGLELLEAARKGKPNPDAQQPSASKAAAPPATPSAAAPKSEAVPAPAKADSANARDLGADIRGRARTVRSAELAAKHENVQVLSLSTITSLVEEAVAEAVQRMKLKLETDERQRLLKETEELFHERLRTFQAEKADVEAKATHLAEQLARARSLLEEERQKVVKADQFTVSDAGLVELEKRLSRLVDRALLKQEVGKDLEAEMRDVIARLLDDEREKMRQKAHDAQNEAIALLERKIQRLSSSLDETQKAKESAERKAQILEASAGNLALKNIYEAGLKEGDPMKERKLALLKEIVDGNREVRQRIAELGLSAAEPPPRTSPEAGRREVEEDPHPPQTETEEEVSMAV
jgi:hypothetical protein